MSKKPDSATDTETTDKERSKNDNESEEDHWGWRTKKMSGFDFVDRIAKEKERRKAKRRKVGDTPISESESTGDEGTDTTTATSATDDEKYESDWSDKSKKPKPKSPLKPALKKGRDRGAKRKYVKTLVPPAPKRHFSRRFKGKAKKQVVKPKKKVALPSQPSQPPPPPPLPKVPTAKPPPPPPPPPKVPTPKPPPPPPPVQPPPPPVQPPPPPVQPPPPLPPPIPKEPPKPKVVLPPPPPPPPRPSQLTPTTTDLSGEEDEYPPGRLGRPRPRSSKRYDHDLDDDEELSSLSRNNSLTGDSSRLNVSHDKQIPDDLQLYNLTKNEEIVYRRNLSEMRWEAAESMLLEESETEGASGATTEAEASDTDDAALTLYEHIQAKHISVPTIAVNERKISLSHLDPKPGETEEGGTTESETYDSIFQLPAPPEEILARRSIYSATVIDEAERRFNERVEEETRKTEERGKLWRRRLIVVILLNFVVRFRKKMPTFNELIVPMVISSVLLMGMILNTEDTEQFEQVDKLVETATEARQEPFETVDAEYMFSAFCSNDEICGEQSQRYFFIVYSPKNNFTTDLMRRTVKLLYFKLEQTREELGFSGDRIYSMLIGVDNSSEVQRICRDQWESFDESKSETPPEHLNLDHEQTNEFETMRSDAKKALRYPVGIIFSFDGGLVGKARWDNIQNDKDLPLQLGYTIRTFFSGISNTVEGFPFREKKSTLKDFPASPYLYTGVIGLQVALDLAFAQKIIEKAKAEGNYRIKIGTTNPTYVDRQSFYDHFVTESRLRQFEYPAYKDPENRRRSWVAIIMTIILSYIVCDITVAQEIVYEQQRGSIELLKIHGMTTSMRWIAYTIFTICLRAITSIPTAVILHSQFAAQGVAPSPASGFDLWIFLVLHGTTATCFNCFITTGLGIKKPELAGMTVACFSFLSFLGPLYLFEADYLNRFSNIVLCYIFPNWSLANGIYHYLKYEIYEEDLNWYDFAVLVDTDTHKVFSLQGAREVLIHSMLIYMGLTIYLDHILQREFSPKENWLFFLKSLKKRSPANTKATRPIPQSQKPSVYEGGPHGATFGPRFRNVTVVAGKKTLLDNISLDIYEGEVTCVVGQIGAGKSDFLNVTAGVSVPSSGFVDIKGLKVQEYHDITNRYVSLCPQKQLLMESLSVEDHIRLCCMLHGTSYGRAKVQANFLLRMFGLMSMRRHNFRGLTSSDTKKVLIAMALSKSPSLLLLDNPMDQLDSASRFQFWRLLQELKPLRSIIVTCTKLEDAILYGDRIAILSQGKLICYGKPSFIKLHYSLGCILTLRKADRKATDMEGIQKILMTELKGAQSHLLETKGLPLQTDCIQFILPFGKFYSGVIKRLEDNLERLGISTINLSQPSLWSLFHAIANHNGIERVLALHEVRFLKGIGIDEHQGFETAVLPPIPVQKDNSVRSVFHVGKVLVMKKLWYYRQKYPLPLMSYMAQIFLMVQLIFFAQLFLIDEPEAMSKVLAPSLYSNKFIIFRSADNEHNRRGWSEAYQYVLTREDHNVEIKVIGYEDRLQDYLDAGLSHSLTHYKKQTIFAFERDEGGHIAHYSSNSIHSAPIASHVLMQAFLYFLSPDRRYPYSTMLISHPVDLYPGSPAPSTQSNSTTALGFFLSVTLCLFSAPALRLVMTEKNTRFKTLQRFAGVSSTVYWFSHGIADFFIYLLLLFCICCPCMFFVDFFGYHEFVGWGSKRTIVCICLLWLCWAAIPYTYVLATANWIPKGVTGYGVYLLFHFLFGIIPNVIMFNIYRADISTASMAFRYFFYIFPPYSVTSACLHFLHLVAEERWCTVISNNSCEMFENVTSALRMSTAGTYEDEIKNLTKDHVPASAVYYLQNQISFNDPFRTCCKQYCEMAGTCHSQDNYFDRDNLVMPGMTHDVSALIINGFMYWCFVLLLENRYIQNMYSFLKMNICGSIEKTVALRDTRQSEEPEDVKRELDHVDYLVEVEGVSDVHVYLVQDVTKFFAYKKGLDHVYFALPKNQIMGILGLPKTGKTTLLEALTGNVTPSAGFIFKDNEILDGNSALQLMRNVGYCPQQNCLLPYLTGLQLMTIMGKLRGLSTKECDQHVQWWFKLFGLEDVANKKANTYRLGQERMLSCALALIGEVDMIILDEPTAVMDTLEHYRFWNVIYRLPALQKTVLFTSTNAEEVQYHASKAIILDSGAIVAVGKLGELFRNSNQGRILAIRYAVKSYRRYTELQKKDKINKLKDHVIQFLSPCSLMDDQENLLIYHLKDQTISLSQVFAVMENAKVRFIMLLEHFQVFEPTLEDAIIQFHKSHKGDRSLVEKAKNQ